MKRLRITALILVLLMLFMTACGVYEEAAPESAVPEVVGLELLPAPDAEEPPGSETTPDRTPPLEDGINDRLPVYGEYYYDLVNVVLYLELYDELPDNYITKDEARELGWTGGSVEDYREGAAIGGDYFGNRERLLPTAPGRKYTECDIDTDGYGSRGSRRLVFSNDGLYFYTSDHYETFTEVTVTEDYEVIR